MLTENHKILICRLIDGRLDDLKKLDNPDIDYKTITNYSNLLYDEKNQQLIKYIADIFKVDEEEVKKFYYNPGFEFKKNIQSAFTDDLGSSFLVAPSKSIIRTVATNPEFVDMPEDKKKEMDFTTSKSIVKTTKTTLASNQFLITEELIHMPAFLCDKYYNQILNTIFNEMLNDPEQKNLSQPDKMRIAMIKANYQFWSFFHNYANKGILNNALFKSWHDYTGLYKSMYKEAFQEDDGIGNMLWTDEEPQVFDNRQSVNNETVTLESEYRLTLNR